jgi:hypothetical protein
LQLLAAVALTNTVENMTLTEATATIKSTLAEIGDPTKVDEDERLALLAACDQLKDALESPMETILRMVFGV